VPSPAAHALRVTIARLIGHDDLQVAVAESREEIEAAHGLVCRRYRWRGYVIDLPEDRGADESPRREITFVAAMGGGTIGTCTLGLDGPHGLRADASYGEVIQKARDAGRRVGEITRLAVDSAESKPVLASLFNLAYVAGKAIDDVTDVFIEVNPRHVLFYTRMLGFTVAAAETFCERARAPAILLHVEMDALAGRLDELARRVLQQPLYAQAA
jgi:N-acyl amino acid synthase FeeM